MPAELRHIIFSTADIIDAVAEQQKALGAQFESAAVSNLSLSDSENGPCLGMTIFRGPANAAQALTLEGEELAVAVMKYCFIKKIPLPRHAEKSLHRVNNQLALMISVGGRMSRFSVST